MTFGIAWSAFLTLAVAGPWLAPGYLFGTDWPGPRHFAFPTELSSSAPLQEVLAACSLVLSGEAAGKLFVLAILFTAALLAYLAVPAEGFVARAAAAAVYVVNPFVYGRLHYGQMFLLAAFAVLPWAAVRIRALVEHPDLAGALLASLALVLLGVLSPHVLLMAFVLGVVAFVVRVVAVRPKVPYLRRAAPWLFASMFVTTLASLYWVIPLLAGRGYEGRLVASVDPGELTAYATVPDSSLGLLPNLLGLYGFWAENTGRFTSMKSFVPLWPAVIAALLAVCLLGSLVALRRRSDARGAWLIALVIAGGLALVLEMGYSQPFTRGVVEWMDQVVTPYRGMRDAGKWAALLALVYSQLFGIGTETILARLGTWRLPSASPGLATSLGAALLLVLPLYSGNGLLFGAHGEIQPSQYPSGWYAADQVLSSDPHPGKTLFLPWHEYMSYSFVGNENRVIASPAPTFFSVPILASVDPEIPGVSAPSDPSQLAVAGLVAAGGEGQWSSVLASLGVKYVLVARELNWGSYAYLGSQAGLSLVGDFGSIVLYRDALVR